MALLKENGSLDIERINNLPIEEYIDMIGDFTKEQREEYYANCPLYESSKPVKPVPVDYTLEEDIKHNGTVIINDKINALRKRMNETLANDFLVGTGYNKL